MLLIIIIITEQHRQLLFSKKSNILTKNLKRHKNNLIAEQLVNKLVF